MPKIDALRGVIDDALRRLSPKSAMAKALAYGRKRWDALTRTLALEWAGDRIRVNAVAPGPIPTEGVKQAFTPPGGAPNVPAMDEYAARAIPLGRWGTPEDIGHLVTFLASPAGEWITGAIFVVDGGSWLAGNRG